MNKQQKIYTEAMKYLAKMDRENNRELYKWLDKHIKAHIKCLKTKKSGNNTNREGKKNEKD